MLLIITFKIVPGLPSILKRRAAIALHEGAERPHAKIKYLPCPNKQP